MTHFSYSKNFQGVADVFLRSPELYRPLLDFIENVMVGPSALTKVEREILAAHVSRLNGCDFCLSAHHATLAAMEIPERTLDTLDQGANIEGISDNLRHLLVFAEKLTLSPHDMAQADIDALTRLGIAEQAVEDAINVISLFNYVNRLVDAFGVEGSPDYFRLVGRSLARSGYAGLLQRNGTRTH